VATKLEAARRDAVANLKSMWDLKTSTKCYQIWLSCRNKSMKP